MSLIKNILGMAGARKPDKPSGSKRQPEPRAVKEERKTPVVKAEISSEARQLLELKSEASQYVDKVKQAETLNLEQIDQIKHRISSNYYFDSEVIDQIVDKMLRTMKIGKVK